MNGQRVWRSGQARARPTGVVCSLAATLVAAVGCGAAAAPGAGPQSAISRYAAALQRQDSAELSQLSVDDARTRDEASERALLEANTAELSELAAAMAEAPPAALSVRARRELPGGDHVRLVREAEGWRLDGELLGEPALREPREAAEALRRALSRRDLRAFEAVLTRAARAALEEEIRFLVEGLADPDALEIVIEGEHARVVAPNGATLDLVLEAGEWRLRDVPTPAE